DSRGHQTQREAGLAPSFRPKSIESDQRSMDIAAPNSARRHTYKNLLVFAAIFAYCTPTVKIVWEMPPLDFPKKLSAGDTLILHKSDFEILFDGYEPVHIGDSRHFLIGAGTKGKPAIVVHGTRAENNFFHYFP